MIVVSMLLVVVGFVTLMLGVLGVGEEPLRWVYASIGACLVAAVFLAVGVLRGRPSRRPLAGRSDGGASWAGASGASAAETSGQEEAATTPAVDDDVRPDP